MNKGNGDPIPSRWEGKRCIDFALAYNTTCEQLTYDPHVFSDHKALKGKVLQQNHGQDVSILVPTIHYGRPKQATPEQWTSTLFDVFTNFKSPEVSNTEQEWTDFHSNLEAHMATAYLQYEEIRPTPHKRKKGSPPRIIPQRLMPRIQASTSTYRLRRLQKLLGRIRELNRQHKQGNSCNLLEDNIVRSWPHDIPPMQTWQQQEAQVQGILEAEVAKTHQEAISTWRRHMNAQGRKATRWLHNNVQCPVNTLTTTHGELDHPNQCIAEIQQYWSNIWQRPTQDHRTAAQIWKTHGITSPFPEQNLSKLWAAGNLAATAMTMKGSGSGLDGWSGDEIASFPYQVWEVYSELITRWMNRNEYPQQWQQARQTHIPKHTININTGTCTASDMRPITVFSGFWRVLTSTIARSKQMQEWTEAVLDSSQYGGIKHRDLHQALASISTPFHQDKHVLMSLDYAKCFDNTGVAMTLEIMEQAGFPPPLRQLLGHVWEHQQRYIQFQQAINTQPTIVTNSLPQGDGICPISLNILMSAAARAVRQDAGEGFRQTIFLDDRTFVCSNIQQMIRAEQSWAQWSAHFGLQENTTKTAILCRTQRQRNAIPDRWQSAIREQTRILGVDFLDHNNKNNGSTMQSRVDDSIAMGTRLRRARLSNNTSRALWQSRIVPKGAWGLLFKPIPPPLLKKLEQLKKTIFHYGTMGSTALRTLLEGHYHDIAFMSGIWSLCELHRNIHTIMAQTCRWPHFIKGSWPKRVHDFLCDLGWQPHINQTWSYTHRQCGQINIANNRNEENITQIKHKVRESWRFKLFISFLDQNRRDARELQTHEWHYDEQQCTIARKTYSKINGDGKTIMTGGGCSIAYYGIRKNEPYTHCPLCKVKVVPCWNHSLWHCAYFHNRPTVPISHAAQRLGWPDDDETPKSHLTRVSWMAHVKQTIHAKFGFHETKSSSIQPHV